jgi:hypothetical protein
MLDAIASREPGLLTYGITPPKASWTPQRVQEVAAQQAARMNGLPVDGIVVYDLQDESARTDVERPFPYQACIDPVSYAYDHLAAVELPKVIYRCVAPLQPAELRHSMQRISDEGGLCVLVGAASADQPVTMRLPDAYALRTRDVPDLVLGGVLIGERHRHGHREHERVLRKVEQGASFFITQAVYSAGDTKDVLSDLLYRCDEVGRPVPPVLVTLTPCGSERTLAFLRWLGVAVPRWLANELLHAHDTLAASVDLCVQVFEDLHRYATDRGIPLGCNVESVSLRREEIHASVDLVGRVAEVMGRTRGVATPLRGITGPGRCHA